MVAVLHAALVVVSDTVTIEVLVTVPCRTAKGGTAGRNLAGGIVHVVAIDGS